jgi:uncharacterized protein YabN with tetrapyrrole methylase and pyrophosphatase domain
MGSAKIDPPPSPCVWHLEVKDSAQVLQNWEALKKEEKKDQGKTFGRSLPRFACTFTGG